MLDTGDLGGGHAHDGRGDVAVAPARHVAAGGLHGDALLAGDEARDQLDLGIADALALGLGEAAHLIVSEPDVVLQLLRHLVGRGPAHLFGHDDLALPAVELARVLAGLLLAAPLDVVQNALDGLAHIGLVGRGRLCGLLQIVDCHVHSQEV